MFGTKIKLVVGFLSGEKLKIDVDPLNYLRDGRKIHIGDTVKGETPLITKIMSKEIEGLSK